MAERDKEKGYAVKQEDQVNVPFRLKMPFLSHLRDERASAEGKKCFNYWKIKYNLGQE